MRKVINPYISTTSWEPKSWQFTASNSEEMMSATGLTLDTALPSGLIGDQTMMFWAYRDGASSTETIVSSQNYLAQVNFGQHFLNWASPDYLAAGFPNLSWAFHAITTDGTTFETNWYKDNVDLGTNTGTSARPLGVRHIGNVSGGTNRFWNGYIGEVCFVGKKLNSTELTEAYNGGEMMDFKTASFADDITQYWSASIGSDTQAFNRVSGGVHMNYVNMSKVMNVITFFPT